MESFKDVLSEKQISEIISNLKQEIYKRLLSAKIAGQYEGELPSTSAGVIPTDEQIYQAVLPVYNAIVGEKNKLQWWEKISSNEPQYLKLTPNDFYRYKMNEARNRLAAKNRVFEIDDNNKDVIISLVAYFSGNEEALLKSKDIYGKPLSLHKGLLLAGPVGCGKTFLFQLFANNQNQSYKIYTTETVSNSFGEKGFSQLEAYTTRIRGIANSFGHEEYGVCFDDLGAEETVSYYKNDRDIMEKILLERYHQLPYNFTHLSTNANAHSLKERYGERLADRLREMCNIIAFDHKTPSRRK